MRSFGRKLEVRGPAGCVTSGGFSGLGVLVDETIVALALSEHERSERDDEGGDHHFLIAHKK
jgi:hypothetical protein